MRPEAKFGNKNLTDQQLCLDVDGDEWKIYHSFTSQSFVKLCYPLQQNGEWLRLNKILSKELGRVPEREVLNSVGDVKANLRTQLVV